LAIGIRTFSLFDKRNPKMHLLAVILGGGMSSRLFSKMRDELGICYYVHASHNIRTDHGDLTISAGVDTSRVELAIQTIIDEIKRMRDETVSPSELKRAKDYIAGRTMLNFETSDSQADYVAHQEILRKEIKTPEERLKDLAKVTAKDIQKLAQEFFKDKGLNMAIIGPYKEPNRFDKIVTLGK
jgi:predicted Zn-dependent peptidase